MFSKLYNELDKLNEEELKKVPIIDLLVAIKQLIIVVFTIIAIFSNKNYSSKLNTIIDRLKTEEANVDSNSNSINDNNSSTST